MRERTLSFIGTSLIISGTVVGTLGGVVNSLLYHNLAIDMWTFSNMALLIWAIGFIKEWWNKKLSVEFLAGMYLIFTVFNFYAIAMR